MALKDGVHQAKPALLEPIMTVEIRVPEAYMGEVNRDLNGRRGRVLGMDTDGGVQIITAHVPAGRAVQLRDRAPLADPRPRHLQLDPRPLRRRARRTSPTRSSRRIARSSRRAAATAATDDPAIDEGADITDGSTQELAAPDPALTETTAPRGPLPTPTRGAQRLRVVLSLVVVLAVAVVLIAIRTRAVLAQDLDPDLVTVPQAAELERLAGPLRIGLLAAIVMALWMWRVWSRAVRANLAVLAGFGVVDTTRGDLLFAPAGMDGEAAAWYHARAASGRRLARATLVLAVAALVVLVPSLVAWTLAGSLAIVLVATAGAILGGVLTVAAAGLALGLVDDVEHRETVAIAAVGRVAVAGSGPSIPWGRPVIAVLATLALAVSIGSTERPGDGRTCPTVDATCHVITVQRDQVAADPRGATLEITYAVSPATGQKLGTLLFIDGGPGESGLLDANYFIDGLPDQVRRQYDVLAFDPRGTGRSELRECPRNLDQYFGKTDEASSSFSADFARGCAVEAGVDPAWLSTYGSEHIAGDIEAIRASLGIDRLAVYGVSYGTVIAQRYASAHPDRVSALILDGPVDPAQGSQADWVEADKAFEATLGRVFDACLADVDCRRDLPAPRAALERLLDRASNGGIETSFADISGHVESVTLDLGSVTSAIDDALYDPLGRSLFLHALASDAVGDDIPLGRLVAPAGHYTDETPSSQFTYYATLCADFAGDTSTDAAGYIRDGKAAGALAGTLRSAYYSGLPCVDWAGRTPGGRRRRR